MGQRTSELDRERGKSCNELDNRLTVPSFNFHSCCGMQGKYFDFQTLDSGFRLSLALWHDECSMQKGHSRFGQSNPEKRKETLSIRRRSDFDIRLPPSDLEWLFLASFLPAAFPTQDGDMNRVLTGEDLERPSENDGRGQS